MLEVFAWSSFACNNSSDYRLVSRFASPARARAMQKRLVGWFARTWDHDDDGVVVQPTVIALGDSIAIYHGYCGGFGGDARALLAKAGATFPEGKERVGVPILLVDFELPVGKASDAFGAALATMFAQRGEVEYVEQWAGKTDALAWGQGEGASADVGFVRDGRRISLSWPIHADYVRLLEKHLARKKVTQLSIRLAAPDDLKALRRRDAAARKAATPPTRAAGIAPAARGIPTRKPRVEVVHAGAKDYLYGLASSGDALFAVGGHAEDRLYRSTDGARFTRVAVAGAGLRDVAAHGRDVWVCGAKGQLLRSADAGRSFAPVRLAGARDLDLVAMDATSVVVAGSFTGKGCLRSSKDGGRAWRNHGVEGISAILPTPLGLLIATFDGRLGLQRGGKVSRYPTVAPGEILRDLTVTPCGTILAVGGDARCVRSVDGGPYEKVAMPGAEGLHAVAALPDGRVIAAGGFGGQILVSYDDGRRFELLAKLARAQIFWAAAGFGDAVYLCGMHEMIVRVS